MRRSHTTHTTHTHTHTHTHTTHTNNQLDHTVSSHGWHSHPLTHSPTHPLTEAALEFLLGQAMLGCARRRQLPENTDLEAWLASAAEHLERALILVEADLKHDGR
jgi:hypothetical protein